LGVTIKALTPFIVAGFTETCNWARTVGSVCIVFAACALGVALHCWPVFHGTFHAGPHAAPMIFRISGLTSVDAGKVFARTCKGVPGLDYASPEEQNV
jgi:hypothetical protein